MASWSLVLSWIEARPGWMVQMRPFTVLLGRLGLSFYRPSVENQAEDQHAALTERTPPA